MKLYTLYNNVYWLVKTDNVGNEKLIIKNKSFQATSNKILPFSQM